MNYRENDLLAIAVPFLLACNTRLDFQQKAARHPAAEHAKFASEIQSKSDDVPARVTKTSKALAIPVP
jgi:hypothetical protein